MMNMQCQSYLPVYHSHYDLNVDANGGGARPLYNGNGTFRSGPYNNFISSPPVPQGPFAYEKAYLRQTILSHEVTFRDQVQELHRIYRRQKEMMDEIKSQQLYTNHFHVEAQCSNSLSAKFSSKCDDNTLHSLQLVNSYCKPSTTGTTDNIQTPSIKEHRIPANPLFSQNGGTLTNLPFLESKAKKIGGKFLDLELPAEVYIDDSEEGESLEDARFPEVGPTSPRSLPRTVGNLADLNEIPTSHSEKNAMILRDEGKEFNSGNPRSDCASEKPSPNFLTPQKSDEVNSKVKPTSNVGQNSSVVQALPCFANQPCSSKGAKLWSRNKGNIPKALQSSYTESKLKESVSSITSDHGLNSIDLNSAVFSNAEFTPNNDTSSSKPFNEVDRENKDGTLPKSSFSQVSFDGEPETTRKSKKLRLIDINLPCDPSIDDDDDDDDEVEYDYKNKDEINLNLVMNDDESPQKSSSLDRLALEIDLEAPPSPEVEERPPPRGDSEENQPEEDNGETLEKLAKMAADAIVAISSETWDFQKYEPSDSSTNLEWFAGLICSMSSDLLLEDDFNTPSYHKDTYPVDDFEAMTLELTEMKAEEYWSEKTVQIESLTCSMPFQTRKGRTRRSKRKDFQREVLPSLASLSRYEVTEDIQMIEGLMEAAGTPWHLTRARRACRMGRKPRAVTTTTTTKQQAFTPDVISDSKEEGVFICWGKVNRRPRGKRIPANPSTVVSKWVEFVI